MLAKRRMRIKQQSLNKVLEQDTKTAPNNLITVQNEIGSNALPRQQSCGIMARLITSNDNSNAKIGFELYSSQ